MVVVGTWRIPTLLVQAEDDPFIPFTPYRDPRVRDNPAVRLLATRRGGHTGFWARSGTDPDPHWAEHRAVNFCRTHVPRA